MKAIITSTRRAENLAMSWRKIFFTFLSSRKMKSFFPQVTRTSQNNNEVSKFKKKALRQTDILTDTDFQILGVPHSMTKEQSDRYIDRCADI